MITIILHVDDDVDDDDDNLFDGFLLAILLLLWHNKKCVHKTCLMIYHSML